MAETKTINLFPNQAPAITDPLQGFRIFPITRSQGVDLPGCVSVEEVRLDGMVIPPYVDEKVLDDLTFQNRSSVRVPLYHLVGGPNGPMVVRSLKSNDGAWQVGSTLSVKGVWSDNSAAYELMTLKDLKEEANALGITIPHNTPKAEVIAMIREFQSAE